MKTSKCSPMVLRHAFTERETRIFCLAAAVLMAGMPPASAQRCITLECPSNLVVECREPAGTRVQFAVTATNHCSSNLFVTCAPPSGSVFPPGERAVTCTATDGRSETNQCTFTVTVRDTTAPMLQCPTRILVPCQSPAGAAVYFTVTATDDCDTNVTATCTPPSGAMFSIGTNIVQCTARDDSGNVGTCNFPVIVRGGCTSNACVSIVCPSNIVTQCESAAGARVLFSATATNRCVPTDVRISCEPPSGSVFGVGITTVMCRASDSRGNENICTFTVEVEDEMPPVIQCPSNIVVNAQGPDGAIATWSVSAADNCDSNVTVRCRPPSGSVFPIGTTAVSCVAVDDSGNVGVCGFGVTVRRQPFEIFQNVTRTESNVTLHWFGNGVPQETLSLSPVNWRTLTLPIVQNGDERTMVYPNPTGIRFFRLMANPLAPPPDSDRDGVPDVTDRCPATPPGLAVDACGCANIELARTPQGLTKRLTEGLQSAIAGLQSNPGMVEPSEFGERLSQHQMMLDEGLQQMRAGEIVAGGDLFRRGLSSLEAEHRSLEMFIADQQRMPMPRPEGYGDVTDEDVQLIRLRVLAGILQDAIDSGHAADAAFERNRRAITGQGIVRGEIVEINDAERWLKLDDGKVIGLAERFYADEEVHEGSSVAISSLNFDDGTGIALDMTDQPTASAFPGGVAQVQCLHLRIAPAAQRFPPASYGPYVLHHPDAYEYDGVLWLEEGARLGVTSSGCQTLVSDGVLKYTMKLDVKYISVYGYYKDATLAQALTSSSTPVSLPSDIYPNTLVVLTATVRRQFCPSSLGPCSRLELYSTESYILRVRPRFSYATALYSTTLFDLEDSPNETGFRPANIYSVAKYSVLFDAPDVSFAAEGYGAPGNGSTYPVVVPISLGQNFTVAAFEYDFYKPDELFNFDYTGVTNATALRWPRATGKHNGRSFAYSVAHLKLIRDVVSFCGELPHSFYRLPFQGGWPSWKMGQANNNPAPFATHCPTCYNAFAFDFVADQGTEVLAARGGVVIDLDESQSGNCWNPNLNPPRCNDPCASAPNFIKILHQDGTVGVYMHMPQNGVYVSKGQHVRRGDSIAAVGSTGCSSNPHLHFQVDPTLGASQSTLVRFEARGVCSIGQFYYPCGSNQECYTPDKGDILFSTNYP